MEGTRQDINDVINIVVVANNKTITDTMSDFLNGNGVCVNFGNVSEGLDKKVKNQANSKLYKEGQQLVVRKTEILSIYHFRFQMSFGNFNQAAKSAVQIVQQEMDQGNYKQARDFLFETKRNFSSKKIQVKLSITRLLGLIHSYLQAKKWVALKDKYVAARLLPHMARNMSKFSYYDVQVLTFTVIMCC
ncbi:MAG: putative WD repeat protein [Streblomastix strix]|uniref:Putative WD repeat protein n=1 Tax=Streblomastix strix TaxID=222440 RepID=A0A5J4TI39_9EUKA|nr:MAG: putative WD repeat protein [Streblomastix strix]